MKRRVIRVGVGLVAGWVMMAQGLGAPAESKKAGEKTPAQDGSGAGLQVLEKFPSAPFSQTVPHGILCGLNQSLT